MILIVNGPNLNLLDERDSKHYGTDSLEKINSTLKKLGKELGLELVFFQSNHEGKIIDFLQEKRKIASGVLINPGALTHYSYALRDCLELMNVPIIEVHLSDIKNREKFRSKSVIEPIAKKQISGRGKEGYYVALKLLSDELK